MTSYSDTFTGQVCAACGAEVHFHRGETLCFHDYDTCPAQSDTEVLVAR